MIDDKKIAIIVPVFNEQDKILKVLEGIPDFIDKIYVINDASNDNSLEVITNYSNKDKRVSIFNLQKNIGVGGAITTGYKAVIKNYEDIAVVVAGDGQMDMSDLQKILSPVIKNKCDYSKGNRFINDLKKINEIPKHRLIGNFFLSLFTKIASGYWNSFDSQCGYTAINRRALLAVDWDKCYKRFGCPNDYLTKLNISNMRVCDVPVKPIYGKNWSSKMRVSKVIFPIFFLLIRLFVERITIKYGGRNGHPIFLFYFLSILFLFFCIILFVYILIHFFLTGIIPVISTIFFGINFIIFVILILSSFKMDHDLNYNLYSGYEE